MAILKGGEIDRFLAAPGDRYPIILIYGPDSGLVSERARALATVSVPNLDDPFSVVRMDGDTLASDPARLADEAGTIPMFGDRRLIWVRAGERPIANAVTPLLTTPPQGATIIIEAGDLKKSAPLRVEAERAAHAAVIPCYADEARDIARLVADEVRAAGLAIDREAQDALAAMLGGDRAASRSEIQKLCLYARDQGTITLADVEAICGESVAIGLDDIIDAACTGQAASLDRLLSRASQSGLASPQIMAAMSRHVMALHKTRSAMDKGTPAAAALGQFQPPVFFRRRALVERQLGLWTTDKLARFATRLADATYETRIRPDLADAIAARTLLAAAQASRPAARG